MISLPVFHQTIWNYYASHKRSLPWRDTHDPYKILLSELMLQQTQVARVIHKYEAFLAELPTVQALAAAPTSQVLRLWQGLGYNRRALNLHKAAQALVKEWKGEMPRSLQDLQSLPGIGPYTAGAISAFAFNRPVTFIETNIRRVFIHFFFPEREEVSDKELLPLIEMTVDQQNPREWYYALMDYGAYLPKEVKNPNRRSKHYAVQSKFEGSNRQVRGRILAFLVGNDKATAASLTEHLKLEYSKIQTCLAQLVDEGFLQQVGDYYQLTQ